MAQSSITMFTNDSGAAAGPIAYVQDAFQDVTDTPSTNAGWSSTVSNNPLNNLYGNDDFPRYGPKTLWIKDLVPVTNKQFWINGEPTWTIIWNEPFPSAQGYVFGNVQLIKQSGQTYVKIKTLGGGFGVGGVFARCMFLTLGNTSGSATGTVSVDGLANSTTVDWSTLAGTNPANTQMYIATAHAPANETYNIHDFRLTPNQSGGVFTVSGVVVYSENSSLTIDQFPGTTYNNKTKSTTSANTTLPLPSFGTSLGGRSTIWKNQNMGYSLITTPVSTVSSIAQGLSGTNILNVTTGQGASFGAGYGIITYSNAGSSGYVGIIQSISTDALVVSPTLPFGVSSSIYRYFEAGQSLSINASLTILSYQLGPFNSPLFDAANKVSAWGSNIGVTATDGIWNSLAFAGASGFLQIEGYMSAAEVEWVGMSFSVLSGTFAVNGFPVYNYNNVGFTGLLKSTVFAEAGPGWNIFSFSPGSSFTNVALSRVNIYQRNQNNSASFGILAAFDTLQSYVPRASNATVIPPGVFQRIFSDELLIKGASITRVIGATWPGGIAYACGLSSTVSFQYYGTHFSLVGGSSLGFGASLNLSLDSGSNQGATAMNTVIQGNTTTFHSVSLAVLGGTLFISAIDFFRTTGEMKNSQTFSPIQTTVIPPQTVQVFTSGTGNYIPSPNCKALRVRLMGAGGGGGGSGASSPTSGGNGGNTTFGSLSAGGGSGGSPTALNAAAALPGANGGGPLVSILGGIGGIAIIASASVGTELGGSGGNSAFGGGGAAGSGTASFTGSNGAANSGGGGGGAGGNSLSFAPGYGGAAGNYVEHYINYPDSSYAYSVGAGGTAGASGGGGAGGAGGSGLIIVEEIIRSGN